MKKIIISGFAATLLLFFQSCSDTDFENDVTETVVTSGSADFSKYVALGNSLTAGYRDGTLYADGQMESYPNIIAHQMMLAGGGAFTQPMMPNNVGGFTNIPGFTGKYTLQVVNGSLTPVPSAPAAALDIIGGAGKYFNNMGVPGAKSFHLGVPGYGTLNPYYARFATSPTSSTVIGDALAQSPTFFSLWIGANDVLSYATSGGLGVDQTGNTNPATYGANDISDPNVVAGSISGYVDALVMSGAKGVIANLPNVTSIPYFTTVPAMPITGLADAQVTALNSGYAQYNAGLAQLKNLGALTDAEYQKRLIKFSAGAAVNGAVIEDKDLTNLSAYNVPSWRQTTADDLILLTASSQLTSGAGTATPLGDQYVLTSTEKGRVLTATAAYNAAIKSIAESKGLAFFDANARMEQLSSSSGIKWDGVKYSAKFVTGGAFSLDGVHLTGRGYAIIANEFIKAINREYGSTLPQVNANAYSGVSFP